LRRELCSAERLSEAAIFFAFVSVKTPRFRSSASLSRVARCDQRFSDAFRVLDFRSAVSIFRAVVFLAVLRGALQVYANSLFFEVRPSPTS
jgi:hypothetical protein